MFYHHLKLLTLYEIKSSLKIFLRSCSLSSVGYPGIALPSLSSLSTNVVTGSTVGVYVAEAFVPFISSRDN